MDTWLPSIAEVAMVALHDRHKASPESQLEAEASMLQAAYLVMLLSGEAPALCEAQAKFKHVSCISC